MPNTLEATIEANGAKPCRDNSISKSKGDRRAFLDAFSRTDDIGRRIENILTALDAELNALLESPAGKPLEGALQQLLGLTQIGFDYREELARCHATMWANQPEGLFDA